MALTEQAYNRAAAAEAAERNGRPHLTDARREANATYQRRRARTAVDTLLEIDPEHYDEHTRKVLIETLPRLAKIELWEIRALEQLEPLRAEWCDGQLGYGIQCGLPEGHMGACDPDVTDAQCDCPPHPIFEHVDTCPRRAR